MKLFVQNMVCDRCKMAVKAELIQLGLHPFSVELGEVDLEEEAISPDKLSSINHRFHEIGFALLEDEESQIVERIKTAVIELVHRDNDASPIKHSEYLAARIGMDYHHLSKAFSETVGTTIEQYIILQKIEKVKELLAYGKQTLSEIAWQMGYSSVAALSTQFKKVVGITPTAFTAAGSEGRKTLDTVEK